MTVNGSSPAALEPTYSLSYRGIASDVQLGELIPLLAKLLRLPAQATRTALKHPPLLLTHSPDRDKLRAQQLGLAKAGCIASLESAWRYRDWFIPNALRLRFETGEKTPPTRMLALLEMFPAPGMAQIQHLARQYLDRNYYPLNPSQLLLEREASSAQGAGRWLQSIHRDLQAALRELSANPQSTLHGTFVLYPEDGQQLEELLDLLQTRLDAPDDAATPHAGTAPNPAPLPPVRAAAGTAWARLVALGPPPQDGLSPSQARHLGLSWPLGTKPVVADDSARSQEQLRILTHYQAEESARAHHSRQLLAHFGELNHLPSLPSVALQTYQLAQSPDTNAEALARIVEQDPSLSSRILSMVNSAYFGLRRKVDSISHALVIVGFDELAHLALLVSSETVFRGLGREQGQALWRHSARTADITRSLAARLKLPNLSALYTAALLHDVGKVFLYSFAPRQMADIQSDARAQGLPDFEMERAYFGHDHATLGAALLRCWGLPENLCAYVEQHHGPLPDQSTLGLEAALIALADHIAHRLDQDAQWADANRLRRGQAQVLHASFGQLELETIDLLAEDLRASLRDSSA